MCVVVGGAAVGGLALERSSQSSRDDEGRKLRTTANRSFACACSLRTRVS